VENREKQKNMRIISIRENSEYKDIAIKYLQSKWPSVSPIIYEDSINHCLNTSSPLPQWYLLEKKNEIIGCAGLITNDFISRMDLYPWVCAIYIEENHRGNAYSSLLLDKAKEDTAKYGFKNLYLCTDHTDFYEKYGFRYIGQGYHPWEDESRIYEFKVETEQNK
jgi:N-acetylglutamate synthase-like GNAT family acetyltransferase